MTRTAIFIGVCLIGLSVALNAFPRQKKLQCVQMECVICAADIYEYREEPVQDGAFYNNMPMGSPNYPDCIGKQKSTLSYSTSYNVCAECERLYREGFQTWMKLAEDNWFKQAMPSKADARKENRAIRSARELEQKKALIESMKKQIEILEYK